MEKKICGGGGGFQCRISIQPYWADLPKFTQIVYLVIGKKGGAPVNRSARSSPCYFSTLYCFHIPLFNFLYFPILFYYC